MRGELARQLPVVVYLSVGGNHRRFQRAAERLVTALHVDDGEASIADGNSRCGEGTGVIGSTMTQTSQHHLQRGRIHRLERIDRDHSCDAAHESPSRGCDRHPAESPPAVGVMRLHLRGLQAERLEPSGEVVVANVVGHRGREMIEND